MYIANRLQDIGEATGENIILTFLDWEKAFDKVSQVKMMEALYRMNIPNKMLNIIQSLYEEPSYQVVFEENISEERTQDTGIRQGCPLSP